MSNYTERWVTARKSYPCDGVYPVSSTIQIKPGDKYILATEYPGGQSGYADDAGRPVRMRICAACVRDGQPDDGQQ